MRNIFNYLSKSDVNMVMIIPVSYFKTLR